jgi:opacity protein-like surface antigen
LRNHLLLAGATLALAFAASAAQATVTFDANLAAPGWYYGHGNGYLPSHSTVSTQNGYELGLRAHERFQQAPTPVGDLYTFASGTDVGFDFSFNEGLGGQEIGSLNDGVNADVTLTNVGTGKTISFNPAGIGNNAHGFFLLLTGAGFGAYQNSEPLSLFNGHGPFAWTPNVESEYTIDYTVRGLSLVQGGVLSDHITIDIEAPAGVPEPATWAMMLVGFGGLGAIIRRRRATTSTSFA